MVALVGLGSPPSPPPLNAEVAGVNCTLMSVFLCMSECALVQGKESVLCSLVLVPDGAGRTLIGS